MFKTQYAKVVDSTYQPEKHTKEMIGDVCEIKNIYYKDKILDLYTKEESNSWSFNFSDVLPATEEEYKAQFEKKEIEELDVLTDWATTKFLTKVNELVRAVNKIK